jgi:xanthine dehydrogenase accessory factor
MPTDVLDLVFRLRANGTPFVLATVVASHPPQSVRPGAKAVVLTDGTLQGWVGGGCVRPVVMQEAAEALCDGRSRLVRLNVGTGAPTRHGDVREYPMTCLGEGGVEIFLEPVLAAPRLAVLGATPAARSLVRMGAELGFHVVVAPPGASAEELPTGARVVADVATALADADGHTWVVVATMGSGDEEALTAAAASEAGYVGLIASRTKARHLLEFARASGVAAERLDRVKFPAGLDLGGMSAPEIALSVLAEIVQRRYAEREREGSGARKSAPDVARRAPPDTESTAIPAPSSHPMPAPGVVPTPPDVAHRPASRPAAPFPLDPVCGMPVNPAEARHTLVVGTETLYFCCPHCRAAYERGQRRAVEGR